MFPPRSCGIQNSWTCLAHSCWERKEERRRETSTNSPARSRRNQEIHEGTEPFPEKRKKREEGGQAPEPNKREEGRHPSEPQPEPGGTSKSWWNRTPVLRKERREKKGDKHRNPSRNQEEPANHEGTEPLSWGKKEERRRETITGTPAGTRRNQQIMREQNPCPEERKKREEGRQSPEHQPEPGGQQIMMEQDPFPEEGKKREEGRQAPEPQPKTRRTSKSWWNGTPFLRKERRDKKGDKHRNPQPEPRGTSKSWWNRTPFLRKERREKKADKHRSPSRNQEEPANHEGTEPLSWGKKEERRRETSTGTPAGTRRSQQIVREQRPFLARIENPIQLKSCLGNKSSKETCKAFQ